MIWLVPDIIGNAVAVSLVGVLLGPMIPIVMKVTSGLVPKRCVSKDTLWPGHRVQPTECLRDALDGLHRKRLHRQYKYLLAQSILLALAKWDQRSFRS